MHITSTKVHRRNPPSRITIVVYDIDVKYYNLEIRDPTQIAAGA